MSISLQFSKPCLDIDYIVDPGIINLLSYVSIFFLLFLKELWLKTVLVPR